MKRGLVFLIISIVLILLSSCSSTKILTKDQYMLTKNSVVIEDVKGEEFSSLNYYLLPLPNIKFMGIFNLKTSIYASSQPKLNKKTGQIKDSKFRKWLRESVGEPPVLLDSSKIQISMQQLKIAMKKLGYFNSDVSADVIFAKHQKKKAQVVYHVTAHHPYFVRSVSYHIDIPEYKKIIVLNSTNCLIRRGMQYNEDLISNELSRMVKLLRDEGYYYVNNSMISCEVDTINSGQHLDQNGHRTVTLEFYILIPKSDRKNSEKYLFKYFFNDVSVYSNFDMNVSFIHADTTRYHMTNNKNDSTTYFFITTPKDLKFDKKNRVIKDIKYRTLADAIYSKKGVQYSEDIYNRSKKSLADLRNFSFIDIVFVEDSAKNDTLQKIGYLNSVYKLTRKKVNSFGYQLDVRTDKAGLSLSYGNKNIFKRADYLNINLFGSYFYYSKDYRYPEIGGSVSLDIPRLWMFRKYQKPDAIRYSTSIKVGANYSGLYKRWMFNTSYSYNWTPSYTVNHSISPIDISTINTDEKKSILHIDQYPESYQMKFDKFFLLSFKYAFNYIVPIKKNTTKHNMRFSLFFESTGLLLGSLNKLISPDKIWNIGTYKYSTFENIEFLFRYNYNINENNSVATRFNVGVAYPIFANSTIPYEKGYYVGGSNSMRAWSFRSLGPGSYNTNRHLEYTGDIKLEINVEYRGTIYKAFKYGIFVDMGNIWLAKKQADMPNANFSFDRFYKEIAIDAGVGLRLDFNFFIIRLDYAVPMYNPNATEYGRWINKNWVTNSSEGKLWKWAQGFKFAIGHAF